MSSRLSERTKIILLSLLVVASLAGVGYIGYLTWQLTHPAPEAFVPPEPPPKLPEEKVSEETPEEEDTYLAVGGDPSWFPDNRRIAFGMEKDGNSDVFVVDRITKEVTRLTTDPKWEHEPSVSPDGRYIVYVVQSREERTNALWLMNSDGTNQRELVKTRQPTFGSWKGSKVGFVENGEAFLINPDGTGREKVVSLPENIGTVAWSKDEKTIAYTIVTGEREETLYVKVGETTTKIAGGGTVAASIFQEPFTPDGRKIYYFVGERGQHPYIKAANIDGSGDQIVISGREYGYGDPAVSPDGNWLVYIGGWPGNIYVKKIAP